MDRQSPGRHLSPGWVSSGQDRKRGRSFQTGLCEYKVSSNSVQQLKEEKEGEDEEEEEEEEKEEEEEEEEGKAGIDLPI